MTYTVENFKTKKALKEAVSSGKMVTCFEPGLGSFDPNGTVYLEGPHYPEPHRWYAQGTLVDGYLTKVS